jgi:NitT/TauT family transport system permease protein
MNRVTLSNPRHTHSTDSAGGARKLFRPTYFRIGILAVIALVVWQIASSFTPDYIVPPLSAVGAAITDILTSPAGLSNLTATLLRVAMGLASAFVVGVALGLATGVSERASGYILPVVRFIQGIPSLSWVVIAVIWFQGVELRVWFVIILVTLPGFALQTDDSYRAIPAELRDMARSYRPTRRSMFRDVTLPGITPGLFTAWKVNLGLGIRMVLVAELVGASTGVGNALLTAQQLFDMAAVVAWTLTLAVCMLILQGISAVIEKYALRYRPSTSH